MANPNQVSGKITISTASMGVLRSKPGATLDFGGFKRDVVEDDQGIAGYTETPVAPSIEGSFVHKGGLSIKGLADITNEDISFETDTGSHFVIRQAWCTEPPQLASGEVKLKFTGISCDEVTS